MIVAAFNVFSLPGCDKVLIKEVMWKVGRTQAFALENHKANVNFFWHVFLEYSFNTLSRFSIVVNLQQTRFFCCCYKIT